MMLQIICQTRTRQVRGRGGSKGGDLEEEIKERKSGDETVTRLSFKLQRGSHGAIWIHKTTSFVFCCGIQPTARGQGGG
jgi:hypothetical protein